MVKGNAVIRVKAAANKRCQQEKNAPSYYAIRGGKIAGYGGIAWLKMGVEIEDVANTAAVAVAVGGDLQK